MQEVPAFGRYLLRNCDDALCFATGSCNVGISELQFHLDSTSATLKQVVSILPVEHRRSQMQITASTPRPKLTMASKPSISRLLHSEADDVPAPGPVATGPSEIPSSWLQEAMLACFVTTRPPSGGGLLRLRKKQPTV